MVTGASSGIGEITALSFADQGAAVVVAARRADKCEDLVRQIEDRGGRALAVGYGRESGRRLSRGCGRDPGALWPLGFCF